MTITNETVPAWAPFALVVFLAIYFLGVCLLAKVDEPLWYDSSPNDFEE